MNVTRHKRRNVTLLQRVALAATSIDLEAVYSNSGVARLVGR